jgi:hypothetical protein
MERAFLTSPTEAAQSHTQGLSTDQDRESAKLCAQFAEVLERGREARKREVANLELRLARVETMCSNGAWVEALERERAARQKEVAELRGMLTRDRLLSSTGGTTHRTEGELDPLKKCPTDMSEVAEALEAAIASSKSELTQHIMEMQRDLSEHLMDKLRLIVGMTEEDWESTLQDVGDLESHRPDKDRFIQSKLPHEFHELSVPAERASAVRLAAPFEGMMMTVPSEQESGTRSSADSGTLVPQQTWDSKGHAVADDIAHEGVALKIPAKSALQKQQSAQPSGASGAATTIFHSGFGASKAGFGAGRYRLPLVSQGFGPGCFESPCKV